MHLSDDERRARIREGVVSLMRETIARREEIKDQSQVAQKIFEALVASPTWQIVEVPKPEGFVEPEEIWSETPVVTK